MAEAALDTLHYVNQLVVNGFLDLPVGAPWARSRMPYGLPNDPVMMSRWRSAG
jgi:hypothetical protein